MYCVRWFVCFRMRGDDIWPSRIGLSRWIENLWLEMPHSGYQLIDAPFLCFACWVVVKNSYISSYFVFYLHIWLIPALSHQHIQQFIRKVKKKNFYRYSNSAAEKDPAEFGNVHGNRFLDSNQMGIKQGTAAAQRVKFVWTLEEVTLKSRSHINVNRRKKWSEVMFESQCKCPWKPEDQILIGREKGRNCFIPSRLITAKWRRTELVGTGAAMYVLL